MLRSITYYNALNKSKDKCIKTNAFLICSIFLDQYQTFRFLVILNRKTIHKISSKRFVLNTLLFTLLHHYSYYIECYTKSSILQFSVATVCGFVWIGPVINRPVADEYRGSVENLPQLKRTAGNLLFDLFTRRTNGNGWVCESRKYAQTSYLIPH